MIVYKIVCNTTGKQYVGATTQSLSKRLSNHVGDFRLWKKQRHHYVTSFSVLESGDYEIHLLEECDNKEQLQQKERYYVETLDCVNRQTPGRSKSEYYRDNREEIVKKKRELLPCFCGFSYSRDHKARHEKTQKHKTNLSQKFNDFSPCL